MTLGSGAGNQLAPLPHPSDPYTLVNFLPRHVPRRVRHAEHSGMMRDVTTTPRRGGPAPYGWRWDGRVLVEHATEQHVRWLVLHLHRRAWSLAQIATELERLALPTREGGLTWPRTTLHRIVSTAAALESTG